MQTLLPRWRLTLELMAQAKPCDQCAVAIRTFLTDIGQKPTALTNHHYQTTTRMLVMLMNFEMFGKLINTPGQERDLDLWRTCIQFVNARIGNDFGLFFNT